jgi:hypothetical protein
MIHFRLNPSLSYLCLSLLLSACGGGGGASSGSASLSAGVFLDSAVAGISYQITSSGDKLFTTDAKGQFYYTDQDKIVFSIGDIKFPATSASALVTPMSISGKSDLSDPSVINMAYFLQSLDSDSDPSNGITIDPLILTYAKGKTVDFTLDPAKFTADTTVIGVIQYKATLPGGKVSTTTLETAADHIGQTLLGIVDTQSLPTLGCNTVQAANGLIKTSLSKNLWASSLAKPVNPYDWFYDSVFKPMGADPQGDFVAYQPDSNASEIAAAKNSDHWFPEFSATRDIWFKHRQNAGVILRVVAKKNPQENENLPAYAGTAIYLHYTGPAGSHLEFELEPGDATTVFLSFTGSSSKTKYTGTAGKDGVVKTGDDGVLSPTVGGSQWTGHIPGEVNFPKNIHIGATSATGRQLPATSCALQPGGAVLLWTRPSSGTDLFFSPSSALNFWGAAAPLFTTTQGYQGATGIRSGVKYLNVYAPEVVAPAPAASN